MRLYFHLVLGLLVVFMSSCTGAKEGKHLFILSGQSNMVGLRTEESFTPTLEKHFGENKVIVIKDAMGSQSIARWYRGWDRLDDAGKEVLSDLYDSLMVKIYSAIQTEEIETITFIWMQGERDARKKHGDIYEKSLIGLYDQLNNDLPVRTANFIIGRLSDFDMENVKYPHWTMVRDIQVKVGESHPRFGWVDTDDLNDGVNRKGMEIRNDLHMSADGYVILGQRFADKAIALIEENK